MILIVDERAGWFIGIILYTGIACPMDGGTVAAAAPHWINEIPSTGFRALYYCSIRV
jgi:hypothetical protein